MTRRFRRRPSTTVFVLLALGVVVFARYSYDRARDRADRAAGSFLQEGECAVVRVIDGDTIVVRQATADQVTGKRTSSEATIRLLGIDCPEYDQPLGQEATALTRQLLAGGAATLRFDRRRLDRYERFLAYVYVDDRMVNVALVEAGLAREEVYPGDSQTMGRLIADAEAAARSARRGIWQR